ncbi:MAG: Na+/H+ antiporter NhaA [Sphingobium sp.]|uniref:Na+/H+ antiporter NhaA n=1 Tax=Sphingobium sp. TaxID=1912891 RepID=UPI0029ADC715|nr:Na+/H+ antiporter NhaA [Sphingobium sp.]MDX3910141.1 Na+/H+ antiporter NhaA [Sphingobium sp.]
MRKRSGHHSALRDFLQSEASGGIILIAAAAAAMIVANCPLRAMYEGVLHTTTGPVLTQKLGPMNAHLWINDGLMAIFFLLVGLEIKRELVDGRLSNWRQRRLPFIAAGAGMVVPAILYLVVTGGRTELSAGWAIPAATDIAFAIGVLALLGSRAPTSLKLFLTTVAIVDDMGAVAVIAVAYTASINCAALFAATAVMGAMFVMNRAGVRALWPYLLAFVLLWYAVLLSGVHATVAGVLAAMLIPIMRSPGAPDLATSPLHRLEHGLHPWVAYMIVPLFGFANAGVSFAEMGAAQIFAPLPLGIAAGLFIGKQLGIFASVWLAVRIGWANRPSGSTWLQIYGVALLCGIGFTMSLFIGALAFPGNPALVEEAKIGVLGGSVVSAVAGFLVLRLAPLRHAQPPSESIGASPVQ